jgi:hypothetical protein
MLHILWTIEEACPKDAVYLTTSKVLVPSSYEREDFILKRQIGYTQISQ